MEKKPLIDFETERLHIRSLTEGDKDAYMSLRINNSNFISVYSLEPKLADDVWECEFLSEDDIYLAVTFKSSDEIIASASIQRYKENNIELGYDVYKEYQKQGIASEILTGLVREAHQLFKNALLFVRIDKVNIASRRVAEKCGGKLIKNNDSQTINAIISAVKKYSGTTALSAETSSIIEKIKDSVCIYKMSQPR